MNFRLLRKVTTFLQNPKINISYKFYDVTHNSSTKECLGQSEAIAANLDFESFRIDTTLIQDPKRNICVKFFVVTRYAMVLKMWTKWKNNEIHWTPGTFRSGKLTWGAVSCRQNKIVAPDTMWFILQDEGPKLSLNITFTLNRK